ncbi:LysR family transcriptional regulator [Pseudomonas soli]|uniref:DNA-binding transcriptional regulator, LysR family n=2 Tax=Pseudomonas TaxID=286 RepID=A0A1H9DH09_9PSED|nr:LysR family transcriptional regulator [Pseudomonas soli]MEE1882781.1 LysR family transcriptional regulator [Pseudomonas soli]NBK40864.1 LysR family transcriptional regulator [Pseudomonas soli]WJO24192.1 LysR family transcriptional regulator [Pseudomonas soli]SEQ12689.1 DNA-binding transcriptional regulator, LysR family [Pseudomonas soli]
MPDRLLNDRLDWNLLRTFRVIGQELSISRAAARLHLTQPAVSQALKRLEEQLGRQLIARRGPRFVLTEVGEQLFQLAGEVYGQMSQIGGLLEQPADELVGKVRLLMISRIVNERFDDFLADFHRQHPRVELEIDVMRSSDIVAALQEKTATAGLSLNRRPQPRLEQRLFLRQRYAFFCGKHHALFGQMEGDLQRENFVSFTSDQIGGMLSPLTIFRDQQGFAGRIVASSPSLEEVRRLVIAGFGIGCLPEHVVAPDVDAGLLWKLPPQEGIADVDIHLLWKRDQRMSRAESLFIEALLSAATAVI